MHVNSVFFSSLGKKYFMGLSGLMLSGFIIVHLIGNLALLNSDRDPFNKYAHFLTQETGSLLYIAEFTLASIFLIHFIYAIVITYHNFFRARPVKYKMVVNAGHTSRKTIGSVTMIYTGLTILVFLVLHLLHFKYGQVVMYTTADGKYIRDLYSLVYQFFGNPVNVIFYILVMVLLGFHLSHGAWSAFQSLGINGKRFTPVAYSAGTLFAIIMAVGFIGLPVYIFILSGGSI
ncbi:MAG: succinate dehydrogenase cytochrome b subunit [Calditrichaceae bacterium]|nr:succinate dehydrogenase cytochrome b subunit [Calditrichaceae bacterium]MBN2709582.1 succinate dehydrogenase cytochrome b subunit [Calditrichaceae bacterium]